MKRLHWLLLLAIIHFNGLAQVVNFLPSNDYVSVATKGPGSYYFQVSTTTSCAVGGGTVPNDNCPFRLALSGFPCTSSQLILDWETVSFTPFVSGLTPPNIEHPLGNYPPTADPAPCTGFTLCRTANFNYYGPGIYVFRLCVKCPAMTTPVCNTITYTVNPPFNIPPSVILEDITTLTLPIAGTERLDATISDPADAVTVEWSQAGTNPMAITLPPNFTIPYGTPSYLSQLDVSQITKPGTYSYSVTATDSRLPIPGVTTETETFLVKPATSSLGINITPPGTAPDPNVLFTPVNNVPLNAEITGINTFNDKVLYTWTQIAGPTAISLPPPAYTANINDIPVASSTFNCPPINLNALAYGVYTLRLRAEDEYYPGTFVEQDITFEVKPPASNLDVTVTPATPTTIDPYNNFAFSGRATGININSDVIRTYWRQDAANPVQFNTAPFTETFASPNVVPLGTTEVNSNGTLNNRITEGTYIFWYVARDIFYNVADSAKIEIIVKPGESTFALTIDPSEEKTITKTPDGWILNVGEDPQNVPFNVTGKVTGISDKTDYVRTYWRMVFEPDASGGTLNPPLPHTIASPKELPLGTTSDEGQVSFTIANTDAGTYDLWYVARDVFYNKADSIKTRILVKRPVSIQPLAAFTPNGDGMNDVWTIRNIESFPDVGVRIVNERGELVFETDSVARLPERGWDGRRRDGKLASEGAYYYQFFDNRDQTLITAGSFIILR